MGTNTNSNTNEGNNDRISKFAKQTSQPKNTTLGQAKE